MNKNLIELPVSIQNEIKQTLKAFDEVSVIFEYGKYNVSTSVCIKAVYGEDHQVMGTYKSKEVFSKEEQILNYMESFHEYDTDYKGKKDYNMISKLNNMSYKTKWNTKFRFNTNSNIEIIL